MSADCHPSAQASQPRPPADLEVEETKDASTALSPSSAHADTSSRNSLCSTSSNSSWAEVLASATSASAPDTTFGLGISCPLPPPRPGRRRAKVSSNSPPRTSVELVSEDVITSSGSSGFSESTSFTSIGSVATSPTPLSKVDPTSPYHPSQSVLSWSGTSPKVKVSAMPPSSTRPPRASDVYQYPSVPIDHIAPYFTWAGDRQTSPRLLFNGMLHLPGSLQLPRYSGGHQEHFINPEQAHSTQVQAPSPLLLEARNANGHSPRSTLHTDFESLSVARVNTPELRGSLQQMFRDGTVNASGMPTYLPTASFANHREPSQSGVEEADEAEAAQHASVLTPPVEKGTQLEAEQSLGSIAQYMYDSSNSYDHGFQVTTARPCIQTDDVIPMSPMPPRRPKPKSSSGKLSSAGTTAAAAAAETNGSNNLPIKCIRKMRSSSSPVMSSRPSTSTFGGQGQVWAFGARG
ncbi:unnamed protein product [Tilletia controversa]|uniref:Uncharacterized protein n=3 Tax=Tilletia TaxID=13289 RepID=A0A8X7MXG3_9BASI|nr:hypothetical protein CF335_g6986 [Tilletia laevis]KAE8205226.1 hypothetical protein CF328_g622 [Tilletia controversa]KAE8264675.1 hypothetical protein A4X03_0g785 [Tilletia caries]KAE8199454.1 hypothetical protein CF336_g1187 [Tilletia laevis]KAE8253375.1 hypothetical protein A4X06_0g1503 [Tilletia controversa]